jgi:hypothetical protein
LVALAKTAELSKKLLTGWWEGPAGMIFGFLKSIKESGLTVDGRFDLVAGKIFNDGVHWEACLANGSHVDAPAKIHAQRAAEKAAREEAAPTGAGGSTNCEGEYAVYTGRADCRKTCIWSGDGNVQQCLRNCDVCYPPEFY